MADIQLFNDEGLKERFESVIQSEIRADSNRLQEIAQTLEGVLPVLKDVNYRQDFILHGVENRMVEAVHNSVLSHYNTTAWEWTVFQRRVRQTVRDNLKMLQQFARSYGQSPDVMAMKRGEVRGCIIDQIACLMYDWLEQPIRKGDLKHNI